jgi:hypothetical protein
MFNTNKVLMSLFVILMLMAFYIESSYSQDKPSREIIKQIIMNGYSRSINSFTKNNPNIKVSDLKFDSFKKTKGFVSKTLGASGESAPYNIEVNYKISYIESQNLVKWKAEQIKQCEYNIFKAQKVLEAEKSKGNKATQLIDYNKKAIIGNKENIETIKKYPDIKKEKKVIVKNKERMSFIKKAKKWHGYLGWK